MRYLSLQTRLIAAEVTWSAVIPADPLRVVLDDQETVPIGDTANRLHIRALAVEMHWNQSFRPGRDRCFNLRSIDAVGLRIGIHKDSGGAGDPNGFCGGEERVSRGDAFIAATNPKSMEGQPQGVCPIAHANGILQPVISGGFDLAPLQQGSHYVL